MGILSFLSPIQSNLTAVLGGALALSLVGNGGLLWYGTHEAKVATSYVTTTKAVNTAAVIHKTITENRDAETVQSSQAVTTGTIASDIASLRSKSRIIYLPQPAASAQGTVGPSEGAVVPTPSGSAQPDQPLASGSSQLVPLTQQEETDREICVTNTDLVKGWQTYYQSLLIIQKEESVGTTNPTGN
jgi:hypothetical protein